MTDTHHQIKVGLFALCQRYVQKRIDTARQAMEAAQEAANSESKSSAGDKYETGRAMAQLERDRHAQLLAEAVKIERELKQLVIEKSYEIVQPGSVAITNRGLFFISIGAGKMALDGVDYFAVSAASPIGTLLAGHRVGDTVTFNKMAYQIQEVF
ncbi:3-oxoacyl-ACP synthase [Spirosoma fluviale]|uniref:Transcription elongation factor, GreA/GreB family n=1 Tax=Spirosoma fluviale TaxID=1597977 RepID=A0A286GQW4_9BACT|nr:3-oxoacyl-ACP synthase [Spirosoma fluviale]SOD97951.1 Transcription elongation factor, GreA/GreB family [Spirosoma fluviale]